MQTAMYMKVNGLRTKHMGKAFTCTGMGRNTQVSGMKISSMGLDRKLGQV